MAAPIVASLYKFGNRTWNVDLVSAVSTHSCQSGGCGSCSLFSVEAKSCCIVAIKAKLHSVITAASLIIPGMKQNNKMTLNPKIWQVWLAAHESKPIKIHSAIRPSFFQKRSKSGTSIPESSFSVTMCSISRHSRVKHKILKTNKLPSLPIITMYKLELEAAMNKEWSPTMCRKQNLSTISCRLTGLNRYSTGLRL